MLGVAVVGVLLFTSATARLSWDSYQYADTARHLAHGDGFVTHTLEPPQSGLSSHVVRPYYPPGMALLLAPFAAVGHVQLGARVLTLLCLLALAWAAWALGGWPAALIAVLAGGLSPFLLTSAQTVMSDATGAALALATLALLRDRHDLLAGLSAGAGLLVRFGAAPVLLAALLAASRGRRRWLALGASPFLITLAVYQWHVFGAPWATSPGYRPCWRLSYLLWAIGSGDRGVSPYSPLTALAPMRGISPLMFWPGTLVGFWVFAPPLFGVAGLWWAWRRRSTPVGRFVLLTVAFTWAMFAAYYYEGARLTAAAGMVLVAASAPQIAEWLSLVRRLGRQQLSIAHAGVQGGTEA